ncbi:hypothetical protein TVAG_345320 [Trichomonas vaginalis G3]|uniref:Uncharacterized protein n=1 Tax=Trichomonas vaginalis (strain ATCC PRA-98 / G3) TaxID=412133 RepID=A2EW10_TRIV3|nr:hypothetical protein TVAGG3_0120540 [Trichomonas vaginalis G3]EAY03158.1 hypothetical protein TVAG_345320 [Trichomonas vaginalis G3]KAI5545444.1 hypothetical protein TVAGG3_0120540 [Trichomonas vaginalis G3]|eukprot:XP_001315381.1 hypothetical protein [Trichomonas vaginalis G3]
MSATNTLDDSGFQQQLNESSHEIFEKRGAANHLRAQFVKDISKIVINSSNPNLISIQPHVKPMDSAAWSRCLCFVVAYLRRYKMEQTLQAMKHECPILPKNTGFHRASDLEIFFGTIKKTAIVVADQSFDERVIEFKEKIDSEKQLKRPPKLAKRKVQEEE